MRRRRKQSKGEKLFSTLAIFLFALWWAGMLGHDYYWQSQIQHHGIEVKAYSNVPVHIRQKPLEPKRYFAYLTYQPLGGREPLISDKVEISAQDATLLKQQKPINILYIPKKPQKILPKNPRPAIFLDVFPWLFLLLLLSLAFYEYLAWRKAE